MNVEGFKCYQNIRNIVHCRGRKGSGGVCFRVKETLFKEYFVNRVDHGYEGVLALKLQDKVSKFILLVIGTYLPPESSAYQDDPDKLFQELLSLLYENTNVDVTSSWRFQCQSGQQKRRDRGY